MVIIKSLTWFIGIILCGIYLSPQGVWAILSGFYSIFNKSKREYAINQGLAYDQGIATMLGCKNPDLTISSEIGWRAYHGCKTAQCMAVVVNLIFYIAKKQENHCYESIEWHEYGVEKP